MERLELVRELIKLMKDNGLSSLKCDDVELVAGTVKAPIQQTKTPERVPELSPEEILSLDNKDLAELITWSTGGDAAAVSKLLAPRK